VFHPATAKHTFFSATFSEIDHMLDQKAHLNKYKKADHNSIKLEINNKRNSRKYSNTWRLNNTVP
jgi:hypothetical protein